MNNASTPLVLILATAGWSLTAAQPDLSKLPPPAEQQAVTYAKDIRPLFEASCFNCHGERRQDERRNGRHVLEWIAPARSGSPANGDAPDRALALALSARRAD